MSNAPGAHHRAVDDQLATLVDVLGHAFEGAIGQLDSHLAADRVRELAPPTQHLPRGR